MFLSALLFSNSSRALTPSVSVHITKKSTGHTRNWHRKVYLAHNLVKEVVLVLGGMVTPQRAAPRKHAQFVETCMIMIYVL